jgi:hypothetical protein
MEANAGEEEMTIGKFAFSKKILIKQIESSNQPLTIKDGCW